MGIDMESVPPGAGLRFVIASNRPWNQEMVGRLTRKTGGSFVLVDRPENLSRACLEAIEPKYVFFPHWSHKIDADIYANFECVIFHMTDLPFGRGGSPLQNLIARGVADTMITALKCVEALDAGPVYLKRPLNLNGAAEEIYLRASTVIEDMIAAIVADRPSPQPQTGEPTFFRRRRPEEGDLAAAEDLDRAFDLIRMLDAQGYPHAFLNAGGFRLEFTRVARRTGHLVAEVRIEIDQEQGRSDE